MANDKTTVYLIRHGECAGNKENRIRGCVDFPLNENGVLQAHALAEAMKDKKIDYIYTSPLSRATATAAILGEALGLPYEAREGFCNIHLGPWENRIKAELAVEEPEKWQTWLNQPEELVIEGGEPCLRFLYLQLSLMLQPGPFLIHQGICPQLPEMVLDIEIEYLIIKFTGSYRLLCLGFRPVTYPLYFPGLYLDIIDIVLGMIELVLGLCAFLLVS